MADDTDTLFDRLSVQTRIPYPLDVVDTLIQTHCPSPAEGSWVYLVYVEREQRAPGWVVYSLGRQAHDGNQSKLHGYLEFVGIGAETIVRLWTPSPGPSGANRIPYAEFPFLPFDALLTACSQSHSQASPTSSWGEGWHRLLGWIPYLLGDLAPRQGEGEPAAQPSEAAPGEGVAERKHGPMGAHGNTLARVKDARKLVDAGVPKIQACKRAHIDPRTYDRYIADVLDWGDGYLLKPDLP